LGIAAAEVKPSTQGKVPNEVIPKKKRESEFMTVLRSYREIWKGHKNSHPNSRYVPKGSDSNISERSLYGHVLLLLYSP
jgi:hypothetical protein